MSVFLQYLVIQTPSEQESSRLRKPDIFNTDQGSQFTSVSFTQTLKNTDVTISMDGRARWVDNVMIEKLWQTLKYDFVYLHAFETGSEAVRNSDRWITM